MSSKRAHAGALRPGPMGMSWASTSMSMSRHATALVKGKSFTARRLHEVAPIELAHVAWTPGHLEHVAAEA